MHSAVAAVPATDRAAFWAPQRLVKSYAPQATSINTPMNGRYVKRSARACCPTWSIPLTGSNVTKYQTQPTAKHGREGGCLKASHETPRSNAAEPATT